MPERCIQRELNFSRADRYSLSITEQLEDFGHIIMVQGRQKPLNLSLLCTTTLLDQF